jgi:hypothetical protein
VFQEWRQFYIQKIQQAQTQPKIVRLHLSNIRLNRELVQALEDALFKCDDRIWLSVSFHKVDGWSRLLPSLKRVRALSIYGSQLTVDDLEVLFRHLPPHLESLSLEGIAMNNNTARATERAAQALVVGLRSIRHTLTQLRLYNCCIYSYLVLIQGISELSQLECLEFYGDAPAFAGHMPQFLHSLATNPRLLRLVLTGVPTDPTRITHALTKWFSDPSCCLEELHGVPSTLWEVPVPPTDAAFLVARQLFLEALQNNTSLKKLDISFLSIDNLDDLSRLANVIQSNSQWSSLIFKLDIIHSDQVESVNGNANEENNVRLSFLQAVQESSLERIYIHGATCSQPGIWKDWFQQLQWVTHLHWAGQQRLFQAEDHHPLMSTGTGTDTRTTTNETVPNTKHTKIQVALWPLVLARIRQRSDPRFYSTTNAASVLYHILRNGPILLEQR